MKIVQLILRLDEIGEEQSHLIELVKQLHKNGHQILILTSNEPFIQQIIEIQDLGVELEPLYFMKRKFHLWKDIRAILEVRKRLKSFQPDLVAMHSSKAGVIGRIAAKSLGIPSVFTVHGWSFSEGISKMKRLILEKVEKYLAKHTSKIITVSTYDYQIALQRKLVLQEKMETIHNGIPTQETTEKTSNNTPLIIMIARFATPKRQDLLIQALANMQEIPWKLILLGDGPNREQNEKRMNDHNLQARISFLGVRNDAERFLEQADINVLLSDYEGLPLVIIESMRAGIPTVASNVGGVSELIIDQYSGLLVDNNISGIQNAIKLLIKDISLRKQLGDKSRAIFEKHFTIDTMYAKTIQIYQEVIRSAGNENNAS
ncbi:glycosyltransferase family 4 protein [Rummeliibacillus sp. NPDC094406]|uniref:glycosyltransferase family 4 protein n=1 Tax=Rummeliibacillus sp. NPDC094406 TaxID=3364511 RepID=UPI00382565AB